MLLALVCEDLAIPWFHPNMGTAKSTLGEAWLSTRLREMRVIRLKSRAIRLPVDQVHRLTQATASAPFIGPEHPSTAVSAFLWDLSSAD